MEKNHLLRIDTLVAAVSVDEDGHEGLCAFHSNGGWIPLIAADPARLANIREIANDLARSRQIKIRLVEFSTRSEIEVIEGRN